MKKIVSGLMLALVLGFSSQALAQDAKAFTRFKEATEDKAGALQIAQATYKKEGSDVEIVLYGVVHIAETEYYKAVQKDLDAYEVVLWEGVKPGKKKTKPDEGMINIGELQKAMCEMLGLTFQKDGINYKRDNFVWADMDMDQLQEAFGEKSKQGMPGANMFNNDMMKKMGPMLKMGMPFLKMLMKSQPQMQANMKNMMGRQLANAGSGEGMAAMGKDFQRVILIKRNEVVMKFLHKELAKAKKGRIAIFYGAAHMPDFHDRLAKMGYKQTSKSWKDAWVIPAGAKAPAMPGFPGMPKPPAQKPEKPAEPKSEPKSDRRWF